MNSPDQIEAFKKEIWKVIERFGDEFDLTMACVIGTLMLIIHDLSDHCRKEDDET